MAWSGGTFSRANGPTEWQIDAAGGTGIEAELHDAQDNDLADGIDLCLNKAGQNTPTANLPMGGFKHTGAGTATANGQYVIYDQLRDSSFTATVAQVAINNTSTSASTAIARYSADIGGPRIDFYKSRGATVGAQTIVNAGDELGRITFYGSNGTTFQTGAAILGLSAATPGAGIDMPGILTFNTSADATATLTERMRIDSAGNVGIGRSSLGTFGNLEVGGSAYSAIGVVSSSGSGVTAILAANGTSEARLNVNTNHPLVFYTNNTSRMTLSSTGNLTLNTAGAVIAGDFTNATVTSRNYLQTSTLDSGTDVGVIPNGTGVFASVSAYNNSTTTNASSTSISCNATESIVTAGRNGTGTYLPMTFYTNATERLRITANGKFGIGNTAPGAVMEVYNTIANNIYTQFLYSTVAGDETKAALAIAKKDTSNGTTQVFILFAINSATTLSGQINANGSNQAAFGTTSDSRLKENIEDLPPQFDNIMALRPVEFDYIDGSGHQIGFIAQEVMAIYPDLVGTRPDGMYTLTDLNKNDARLIKAFQELADKVADLENRIIALEGA
jgi:hypothetical protein